MKNKGKILSFYQNSDFYIRTGDKKADKSEWTAALSRYRKAYEKDYTNHEACMAYAEMLNHMQLYEESNRLIFRQISTVGPVSDYLFGIACNFYGMYQFEHAKECLISYLNIDPEGFYAYQAADFLDVLENKYDLSEDLELEPDESLEILQICIKAKQFMRARDTEKAREILNFTINGTDSDRAKVLLASLNLEEGKFTYAEKLADEVLTRDPQNVHAKCIMAYIKKRNGDAEKSKNLLDSINYAEIFETDVLQNAATQYLELKCFEKAREVISYAVPITPYDKQVLHLFAIANCTLGNFTEAKKCYDTLLKINPNDAVAQHYFTACRRNTSKFNINNWSFEYELPPVKALIYSSNIFKTLEKTDAAKTEWESGSGFANRIEWALSTHNRKLLIYIFKFLTEMKDQKAEMLLRDYILRMDQEDDLKEKAMISLKQMNAKPPYICYLGCDWIESRINAFKMNDGMPKVCSDIMEILIANMGEYEIDDFAEAAAELLSDYYKKLKKNGKKILSNQLQVYAAVLEIMICEEKGIDYSLNNITEKYGISEIRLNHLITKLKGME